MCPRGFIYSRPHNTFAYQEQWSLFLKKNGKRLRLKKSIMKLLNYQISCCSVLPSMRGTTFRPKLYVYLIISFSSSFFLSACQPPIYFPGCNILAPRFPNTSEFDKYSSTYRPTGVPVVSGYQGSEWSAEDWTGLASQVKSQV